MSRSVKLVLAAGLAVWVGSAIILWLAAPPLGHDEAQYALAFQGMLRDGPLRWVYLSKGMHAVVAPGVWAGGSELAMRALPLLCGLGFALAAVHLAWRVFGATTAAWTMLALATAKPLVRRSTDLLSDFPSAALLLVGTTIVLVEATRPAPAETGDPGEAGGGAAAGSLPAGPSWRLLWAAPLFAAAFYLRYASCVPIAIIGVVALVIGWEGVRRRPRPALAAAALLAALLVPHLVDSVAIMGSPLGVLLQSQRVPQSEVSGLRTYLTSNPLTFYGFALAPLLLLGVLSPVGWIRGERGERKAPRDRRALALWLIGLADIVALGLTALGQARYILVGIALLVILGVELVRGFLAARPPPWRRALTAAAALALAIAAAFAIPSMLRQGEARRRATRPIFLVADVIRRDAEGKPCHFTANHYTQIEWYSGCDGHDYPQAEALAEGHHVYYVRDDSPGWQPSAEELAQPHVVVLEVPRYQLLVIRLLPPPPGSLRPVPL